MLSRIYGIGLKGIEGFMVSCEVDVGAGLPQATLIGYANSAVKESHDRIKTAIKNSGFELMPRKMVINLSPADIRKEGCAYDLPIAIAMLEAYKIIKSELLNNSAFIGELSLGGNLLPVRGVLALVMAAKEAGIKHIFLPKENAKEAGVVEGIDCYGVGSLKETCDLIKRSLKGQEPVRYEYNKFDEYDEKLDFSDINGQELSKRATIIAVSGRHNILYIGPAGTGKSMLAARIPSIMPGMSMGERVEISKLHSICGQLPPDEALVRVRPYRHPHHTISPQALVGGGKYPKPGEISLASGGVLFLDELAEFKKDALEVLRQPLEEGVVSISRVQASYTFPASFLLCAATNPCKCGFYPDRSRCSCDERMVKNYLSKISKPLLDRIDIYVETNLISYEEIKQSSKNKTGKEIRKKVEEVRQIQLERLSKYGIYFNAQMNKQHIDIFCPLADKDEEFLKDIYEKRGMSLRALHKILKVARTIADFEGKKSIRREHLCEAIAYRVLEERYWK